MTEIVVSKNANKEDLLAEINACRDNYIQLISERLGLVIKHQSKDLSKTILDACIKFNLSPQQYLDKLIECENDSPLLDHLIMGITIGETYFFRDKNQMKILQEVVLPELIQRKRLENNLTLRIWSAGCASGEEIYTIAMMLDKCLPDIQNWTLQLLGTDINTLLLKKAIAGRYSEWSMRSISDYYKNRYFTREKNDYILLSKIRILARFDFLNLNDNYFPSIFNTTNAQDLILCRNVLIYFDEEHVKKLMHRLSRSLMPNGYILLGASDPVYIKETNLHLHQYRGSLFTNIPQPTLPQHKINIESIIPIKKVHVKKEVHAPKFVNLCTNKESITTLLNNCEWQAVINTVDQCISIETKSIFLLNAKATALANLGKLEQSAMICQECIKLDPTDKLSYFIYALTLSELNKFDECEKQLRKTLYLDHQFVTAHFQLGLLLLKNNQKDAGIKSLNNALMIAHTQDPKISVPGTQGLNYGRLEEILKNEIALYKN